MRGKILDLLIPILRGTKDDYGKEIVPPLPLSFERVNEGRPPLSAAPLLNLPFEILGSILHRYRRLLWLLLLSSIATAGN